GGFLVESCSAIMWRALDAHQLGQLDAYDVVLFPCAEDANVFRITWNGRRNEIKLTEEGLPVGSGYEWIEIRTWREGRTAVRRRGRILKGIETQRHGLPE